MSGRLIPPKTPSRTSENDRSLSMTWRRTRTSRICSDAMRVPFIALASRTTATTSLGRVIFSARVLVDAWALDVFQSRVDQGRLQQAETGKCSQQVDTAVPPPP